MNNELLGKYVIDKYNNCYIIDCEKIDYDNQKITLKLINLFEWCADFKRFDIEINVLKDEGKPIPKASFGELIADIFNRMVNGETKARFSLDDLMKIYNVEFIHKEYMKIPDVNMELK